MYVVMAGSMVTDKLSIFPRAHLSDVHSVVTKKDDNQQFYPLNKSLKFTFLELLARFRREYLFNYLSAFRVKDVDLNYLISELKV